jgi:hypothetical protein
MDSMLKLLREYISQTGFAVLAMTSILQAKMALLAAGSTSVGISSTGLGVLPGRLTLLPTQ